MKQETVIRITVMILGLFIMSLGIADLVGVREGTIAAAVLVGLIVKFFIPRLGCLDKIFLKKTC